MIVDLQAADKGQAIEELVGHLVAGRKSLQKHRDAILAAVKKRESILSTAIGSGIALPHATVPFVSDVISVMGRSKAGIDFNAPDTKPVHKVILFLLPFGNLQKYQNTLAEMAQLAHEAQL